MSNINHNAGVLQHVTFSPLYLSCEDKLYLKSFQIVFFTCVETFSLAWQTNSRLAVAKHTIQKQRWLCAAVKPTREAVGFDKYSSCQNRQQQPTAYNGCFDKYSHSLQPQLTARLLWQIQPQPTAVFTNTTLEVGVCWLWQTLLARSKVDCGPIGWRWRGNRETTRVAPLGFLRCPPNC